MTGTEYDHRAPTTEESSAGKINNERANLRTTNSVTGSDGIEQHRERFENCGSCHYYEDPSGNRDSGVRGTRPVSIGGFGLV